MARGRRGARDNGAVGRRTWRVPPEGRRAGGGEEAPSVLRRPRELSAPRRGHYAGRKGSSRLPVSRKRQVVSAPRPREAQGPGAVHRRVPVRRRRRRTVRYDGRHRRLGVQPRRRAVVRLPSGHEELRTRQRPLPARRVSSEGTRLGHGVREVRREELRLRSRARHAREVPRELGRRLVARVRD